VKSHGKPVLRSKNKEKLAFTWVIEGFDLDEQAGRF
jgi:hypothetical protein